MPKFQLKWLPAAALLLAVPLWAGKPRLRLKPGKDEVKPLDKYVASALAPPAETPGSAGSLYDPSGRLADLGRDSRASQLHDLVTIVIEDKASALSSGTTSTSRKSSAKASVASLAGPTRAAGPLASLADLGGEQKLDGSGTTSRSTSLETTLTAHVIAVMPNGNLVVEGTKDVQINSEKQRVSVRGVVRWNDLTAANRISSDRLGELEVRVDGKGVVNDSIRRPNFLYRLLLGLLPF